MKYDVEVLVDTREQKPWKFDPEEKKPGKLCIIGSSVATLEAGDYTLKNFENLIVIERKAGFAELMGNMCPREHNERFEREMEKLQKVKYKYILIETNLSNDILGMSVSQMKFGPPCSKILKWLMEIELKYGVKYLFVGDSGKKVARYLFEMALKND